MYSNEPIQFEIKFPTQDPLPTVSSIVVNGNTICAADQSTLSKYYNSLCGWRNSPFYIRSAPTEDDIPSIFCIVNN